MDFSARYVNRRPPEFVALMLLFVIYFMTLLVAHNLITASYDNIMISEWWIVDGAEERDEVGPGRYVEGPRNTTQTQSF